MVADLVVVAVLLALLDRISRGALVNWLRSVRVPWGAIRSAGTFRLIVACALIALCSWVQSAVALGPAQALATVWSGTPPQETELCFRFQRNVLANAEQSGSNDLQVRCPNGGGDFTLAAGGGCPVHGRVPR
jgi:hypothetical protein